MCHLRSMSNYSKAESGGGTHWQRQRVSSLGMLSVAPRSVPRAQQPCQAGSRRALFIVLRRVLFGDYQGDAEGRVQILALAIVAQERDLGLRGADSHARDLYWLAPGWFEHSLRSPIPASLVDSGPT